MKFWKKKTFLWPFAIATFLIVILIWGYFFLNTQRGSRFVLAQIQKGLLSTSNTKMQFDEASIYPFSKIHFKSLKLTRHTEKDRLEVTVNSVDASYSISLLKRMVTINFIRLDEPKIYYHLDVDKKDEGNSDPEPSKTSSFFSLSQALQQLVATPLISVEVKHFSIRNLVVDFKLNQGNGLFELRMPQVNADLQFASVVKKLATRGTFALDKTAQLLLTYKNKVKMVEASAKATGTTRWDLSVEQKNEHLESRIDNTNLQLSLENIKILQTDQAQTLTLNLPRSTINSEVDFTAYSQAPHKLPGANVKSFNLRSILSTGPGGISLKNRDSKKELKFIDSKVSLSGSNSSQMNIKWEKVVQGLMVTDVFKKPVTTRSEGDIAVTKDLSSLNLNANFFINKDRLIKSTFELSNSPQAKWEGDFEIDAETLPGYLAGHLTKGFGSWQTHLKANGQSTVKVKNLLNWNLNAITESITHFTGKCIQSHNSKALIKTSPITIRGDIDPSKKKVLTQLSSSKIETKAGSITDLEIGIETIKKAKSWRSHVNMRSPSINLNKLVKPFPASVDLESEYLSDQNHLGLSSKITVKESLVAKLNIDAATNTSGAKSVKMLLKGNAGWVQNGKPHPLDDLNAVATMSIDSNGKLQVAPFKVSIGQDLVTATAEVVGDLNLKDFQAKGNLIAKIPEGFPSVAGQDLKGEVNLPWTLALLRGKEAQWEGDLELSRIAWSSGQISIKGLSGKVNLSEKLILDDMKLKFSHLVTQNPFERVDYEKLRPLIQGAQRIKIDEIKFEDKKYGPFIGFFSMRQNIIFVHQFDLRVGQNGAAAGEMFLNVYPKDLRLGILSRVTNLNLLETLPSKLLVNVPKGDKTVGGRTGVVVNLNQNAINGRIDITEIGSSQLITLINMLDPNYENDKMNLARNALDVGSPTFVQMAFANGYMDLSMTVKVLGISQPFEVREIPISSWVSLISEPVIRGTKKELPK